MFTFGYKLRLVKDEDQKEYEVFERSVYSIHQQSDDLGRWLFNGYPLNENTVHQLTMDIEGLHTFIDVYFNNKYSLPTSSMMMFTKIDQLRKMGSELIDVIGEVCQLDKLRSKVESGDIPDEFDVEGFLNKYEEAIESATIFAKKITTVMLDALRAINLIIEGDLIKIILGVDIMKEYKKRCKRIPKDKELMTDFVVHFRAITKDDRKYLEKEKDKNERRNRA